MAKKTAAVSHLKAIAAQHDKVSMHHQRQMVHHAKIADHHRAMAGVGGGGGAPGDMAKSVSTKGGAGRKEKVPTKGPRK